MHVTKYTIKIKPSVMLKLKVSILASYYEKFKMKAIKCTILTVAKPRMAKPNKIKEIMLPHPYKGSIIKRTFIGV